MKRLVVHYRRERHDVYIGRGSPFGNPFAIGRDGSRAQVIEKFERWLLERPELVARAKRELRGKVLGCWCAPLACHGDVLSRIANELATLDVKRSKFIMTEEDVHRICESIERIMSHLNADIFEHVIGPYKEPESLAAGVHRVADSLDRIANAIEEATGFWAQPPPKQKSKSKKTKKRSSK